MAKWTKKRVSALQQAIENARMNAAHAATIALAIWEEWEPRKGVTLDERESMLDSLTEALIQISMAIEELENN